MPGDGRRCCRNLNWAEKELCHGTGPRLVGGMLFHNQSCISPDIPVINGLIGVYVMGVGGIGGPSAEKRCPVQSFLSAYK